MRSQQPTNGQLFPRTYRVDARTRHAINFLLVALTGLFLSLPLMELAHIGSRPASLRSITFILICGALLVAWLASGYNKQVILKRDAIEVVGWFYHRRLSFAEIRGRRGASGFQGSGYAYVLVPVDNSKRKLVLPPFLQTDQVFRDWIKTIPKISR
jgi:hypothetical protein